MPFTLSHAGFVLPFRRLFSPAVLCGLMIGAIVPDFAYFVREFGVALFAHTILGSICVSLPIGFAVYLLVVLLIARITRVIPAPHSDFVMSWGIGKFNGRCTLLAVMIAIVVGALSHNFIDSFTHRAGVAVSMFPALRKEIFSIGGDPFYVFRLLQYLGSVIGMAIIAAAYGLGLSRCCRARGIEVWQDFRKLLMLIVVAGLTALLAAALNVEFFPKALDFYAFRVFGFKLIITWLPIIGLAILCLAMFYSPKTNSRQDEP